MGRSIRCSDRFIAWWEAQPDAQTCARCGKAGSKAYVQPQPKGGALCGDCISAHNAALAVARKADLAALPRCEVPGCKARGTYRTGPARVLLCGRHKTEARRQANRAMAGAGALALFLPGPMFNRADTLRMATGQAPSEEATT